MDDLGPLSALYTERFAAMSRLAYLMTGSSAVADEITQEAFMKMQLRWDRIVNHRAYLRQIVVNESRNHQRRRVLEDRFRALEGRVVGPPEIDDTFEALAVLKPRQRAALVLRYYEDLPMAEIADVLGCRVGTARSLVHRGLARMREVMEQ